MCMQINENLFQSLLENTSSVVLGMDAETRLLYANPKAREVLGCADDELYTRHLHRMVSEHKKNGVKQAFDQVIATAGSVSLDLILPRTSGGFCALNGVLSRWQHGDIIGIVFYGMEKALTFDDESLMALLNNLPGYAYRCLNDEKWTSLIVSKGVTEVTGYGQEDFIHNRKLAYQDIVHPDDRLRDWEETQAALREHRRYESSYRIITASGEVRWVLDYGRGIYNADDELVALEGLIIDVTQQKRIEQALQQSEARNAALLDAVPDMMFRINRSGIYLDYKISDKSYVPRSPIIGQYAIELLPEEVAAKMMVAIEYTLNTGEISVFEYQLTPPHRLKDYEARIVAIGTDEVFCIVRDISERKKVERVLPLRGVERVERDLRQSEARLNVLIANTPVMLYALDLDFKFTLSRGALLTRSGLKPDALVGRSIYEVYPNLPSVHEVAEAVRRGESMTYTVHTRRSTYLITARPILDEQGQIVGITGASTDISQQFQAEHALRQAVNQLTMQYEGSRALISATTVDELLKAFAGRAVEAENCHVSLFYVRNDAAGKPETLEMVAHLLPPTPTIQAAAAPQSFRVADVPLLHNLQLTSYKMITVPDVESEQILLTDRNRQMLLAFGTKAFATIPLKLHDQWIGMVSMAWGTPHRLTPEQQQYYEILAPQFAATLENLILFEQIEASLNENRRLLAATCYNEDLLRRFVEHMPLEIAMFDTQMRYLVANRRWLTSYRLDDIDLIGRSHYEVFPEIDERWKEIHRRCLAGEVSSTEGEPFERGDGTIDWVRWEVRPGYTFEGDIGGIVMYTEVINERMRQQKERENLIAELQAANEKAMEASRLKSEFLATMSHELRTPLNTIIGFSGIMIEGIAGKFDDTTRHMISAIYESGENLLSLINDILDISKIEAGWFELVSAAIEIPALVTSWETRLKVLATKKDLDFEVEIDPDLPVYLIGDRERITQIATNLLSNAFKFTDTGKVTLAVRWQEESFIIEVRDTGIGIAQDAMGIIFEAFRQVDSSLRRPYGGTGLGLSIVRRLCEAMDGQISVQSTLGEGSTFTVTLPLKKV